LFCIGNKLKLVRE